MEWFGGRGEGGSFYSPIWLLVITSHCVVETALCEFRPVFRGFLGLPDPHSDSYKFGSGSFLFPIKVLSGLKYYYNFLAENLSLIIKHIFTILKLLNFFY